MTCHEELARSPFLLPQGKPLIPLFPLSCAQPSFLFWEVLPLSVQPRLSSECLIALLALFVRLVCSIRQGSRFFPTGTAPRHTAALSTPFLPSLQTLPSFLAKCFYTPPPLSRAVCFSSSSTIWGLKNIKQKPILLLNSVLTNIIFLTTFFF